MSSNLRKREEMPSGPVALSQKAKENVKDIISTKKVRRAGRRNRIRGRAKRRHRSITATRKELT